MDIGAQPENRHIQPTQDYAREGVLRVVCHWGSDVLVF